MRVKRRLPPSPGRFVGFTVWGFILAVLLVCTYLSAHIPLFGKNANDEFAYLYFARNLTHGTYAVASNQTDYHYLWHGPGLPLLLAPFTALHLPVSALRLVGPLSLLGAGVLFTRVLSRFVSSWAALLGGVVLSVYPPLLEELPRIAAEPFALMLLIGALLALVKSQETGAMRWAILAGLLGGWMVLARSEEGWLLLVGLVVSTLLLSRRRDRRDLLTVMSIAVATLVCVPWLVYTASLAHKVPYWDSAGGASLYWMAVPAGVGSYMNTHQALTLPQLRSERPFIASIQGLPQVERDSRMQTAAIKAIENHPANFASHVLDNISRLLLNRPYSFAGSPGRTSLVYYALPNIILGFALLIALVRLLRRRPAIPYIAWFVIIFGALNFVLHVPVAGYPRMMALTIPAVVLLIALGWSGPLPEPNRELAGQNIGLRPYM